MDAEDRVSIDNDSDSTNGVGVDGFDGHFGLGEGGMAGGQKRMDDGAAYWACWQRNGKGGLVELFTLKIELTVFHCRFHGLVNLARILQLVSIG